MSSFCERLISDRKIFDTLHLITLISCTTLFLETVDNFNKDGNNDWIIVFVSTSIMTIHVLFSLFMDYKRKKVSGGLHMSFSTFLLLATIVVTSLSSIEYTCAGGTALLMYIITMFITQKKIVLKEHTDDVDHIPV